MRDRPRYVLWLVNGDMVITLVHGDTVVADKEGFVHCEYPLKIVEMEPTAGSVPGAMRVNYKTQGLTTLAAPDNVWLLVCGYAVCNNTQILALWDNFHAAVMAPHIVRPSQRGAQ